MATQGKKLINNPDDQSGAPRGLILYWGTYDKVAVICGMGSMFELLLVAVNFGLVISTITYNDLEVEVAVSGFVGQGMLTAAVSGDVFTSPPVNSILAVIRAVTGSKGCLLVVMVAGAAVDAGLPLGAVAEEARRAVELVGTMGVALSVCTLPGQETSDRLGPEQMELGLGLHGEPGAAVGELQPVDVILARFLKQILSQMYRGATSILEDVKKWSWEEQLESCMTYSVRLQPACTSLKGYEAVTAKQWANALQSSITAISKYGGAHEGYRTMLDALIPASKVLTERLEARDEPLDAFMIPSESALAGAQSTRHMQAHAERSSYIAADKLALAPDPGAMAAAAAWYRTAALSLKYMPRPLES